jgi:hypothetical protein
MMERLVESAAWRELVLRPAVFVPFTVIRSLSTEDIDDLLLALAGGSAPERLVAFGMLRTIARRTNELPEVPWTQERLVAFTEIVAEQTRGYFGGRQPWTEGPGWAIRILWAVLDPQGCLSFLLAQPTDGMPAPMQEEVLQTLASLACEHGPARERLEAIASTGGEIAVRARDALEAVGLVAEGRTDEWSRRWREGRDSEALDWLYDKWLSHLPVGYPVDRLLAVLGPPDDGELPDIYYKSAKGHVYVEAYQASGFSGCHRT